MTKKETDKLYYEKNKEKLKQKRKERYQKNKEKELSKMKEYYENNKEQVSKYYKQYAKENSEKLKEYKNKYYKTMHGRALRLASHYRLQDKLHNRGESTLTEQWIIENIFTKPCHYCGESDWMKIGCDRINNDLPHTPDNVVPCCADCNKKKGLTDYDEFLKK